MGMNSVLKSLSAYAILLLICLWGVAMGWKKRFKLKFGKKPAPKPVPVPVPTPPPNTVEKRLAELESRLVEQEREQRRMIDRIALFSGKVSDTMVTVDELKAKVTALEDVCNAAESAIERLSDAVEWLRAHQGDTAGLKEVADRLDEMRAELEAKVADSGASGGV
jgi:uncharacterized coiled-coil protein SlyX